MPANAKRKTSRRAKLYFSAKISDYQFKRVLWQFTLDRSAVEASRHVRLSANSIGAIYTKLRKFFFEYGLFVHPYWGRKPAPPYWGKRVFLDPEKSAITRPILKFHFKRERDKRGQLRIAEDAPDYHFSESHWRFDYYDLRAEHGAESVHRMMYANLLEYVRRFGPVGAKREPTPQEKREGLQLSLEQFDRLTLWLERNSSRLRDPEERAKLRKLREE